MMGFLLHIRLGLRWHMLAFLLLSVITLSPTLLQAQDDGGDKKEKKEKPVKPPKEKPVKAEKEKKEKPVKEKKTKPAKPPKGQDDDAGDDEAIDDDAGGKKKKKKAKKADTEATSTEVSDSNSTASKNRRANVKGGAVKHGNLVPCQRYKRGYMEFIDKNNVHIAIRRKRHKEIHYNGNRGMRVIKNRKISRDQKKDKSIAKMHKDKQGKIKDKGNKLVFKIDWTGECEYKLTFKKSKKPTRFEKGWEMDCRITQCYEDYYDCDCDLHDIIQYGSVRKRMTKQEIATRDREAAEAVIAKELEIKAAEEAKVKQDEEQALIKASEDQIFGPIKRIESGSINESQPDALATPNAKGGLGDKTAKTPDKTAPDPLKKEPAAKPEKPLKEDAGTKPPKEKQEKEAKAPKEKKEKAAKAPKEKKEKAAKAPKEKKEKAPKEPKVPKEKPEKAPKEEKSDE